MCVRVEDAAESVLSSDVEVVESVWIGDGLRSCCDTRSHVVSELVKEVRRMSRT